MIKIPRPFPGRADGRKSFGQDPVTGHMSHIMKKVTSSHFAFAIDLDL